VKELGTVACYGAMSRRGMTRFVHRRIVYSYKDPSAVTQYAIPDAV